MSPTTNRWYLQFSMQSMLLWTTVTAGICAIGRVTGFVSALEILFVTYLLAPLFLILIGVFMRAWSPWRRAVVMISILLSLLLLGNILCTFWGGRPAMVTIITLIIWFPQVGFAITLGEYLFAPRPRQTSPPGTYRHTRGT